MSAGVGSRRAAGPDKDAEAVETASLGLLETTLGALAAARGISTLQLRVLVVVDQHCPLNLSGLAGRLELSASSASRLVDRLVEAGLMTRRASEHSRREVSLSLTAQGRRVLGQVRRSRQRAIGQVLDRMAPVERSALVAGLLAFARAAEILTREAEITRRG